MSCSCRLFGLLLSLGGVALSLYAYYVEVMMEASAASGGDYEALCDVSEKVSCTKVFNTSFARGFGVVDKIVGADHWLNQPSPVYGVIFYAVMIFLGLFNVLFFMKIQIFLAVLSNLSSVYLGYLLVYVIDSVCVVCVATYGVNFLLLVSSVLRRRSYLRSHAGSGYQFKTHRESLKEQERNANRSPRAATRFKKNI